MVGLAHEVQGGPGVRQAPDFARPDFSFVAARFRLARFLSAATFRRLMGQQTNKVEKKKRRLAYLERKKERVKKAIVAAKKAARK